MRLLVIICMISLSLSACTKNPNKNTLAALPSLAQSEAMFQVSSPSLSQPTLSSKAAHPDLPLLHAGSPSPLPSAATIPSLPLPSVESPGLSTRKVSIDPKIGQRFIVGFYGSTFEKVKEQLEVYIRDYKIGGVILFKVHSAHHITPEEKENRDTLFPGNITNDPEALKDLIKAIQDLNAKHSSIPLFIGVDQEGGLVSRLIDCGLGNTRSHQELGQLDPAATTQEATKIAQHLSFLGINLNFAPCLDLALNPDNTVIVKNKRSFSDNPLIVATHAEAYIEAQRSLHILSCCKHFPGHGSTKDDTHNGFTDATDTWKAVELEPYSILIHKGKLSWVMASHVYNKHIDPEHPASLSRATLTDLLRNQLGYQGLIITDDLEMKAIADNYEQEEVIRLGAAAGVDIFLIGNHDTRIQGVERSIQALQELYEREVLSTESVNASYEHILAEKRKIFPDTSF